MLNLKELFETCVADAGDKTRGTKIFLISARKKDPNVTMDQCMKAAGFSSEDPKKAANLAQTFRSKILNPLRDHLAKVKFQIEDTSPIFGRTGVQRTEEQLKIRKAVLAYLPALTRTQVASTGPDSDMSYLDYLIANEDQEDNAGDVAK